MARKTKILLVGADGFQGTSQNVQVKCISWTKIPKDLNFRDFDSVVFSLLKLDRSKLDEVDWADFVGKFHFGIARDIVRENGQIVVVGDPRFKFDSILKKEKEEEKLTLPFLYWTGLDFRWDSTGGDTVLFRDQWDTRAYTDYASKISRWNYSLERCVLDSANLEDYINFKRLKENRLEVEVIQKTIVHNRYMNAIAFEASVVVHSGRSTDHDAYWIGPFVFLPSTGHPDDELLQIVLRDLCGFEVGLPEPEWLKDFTAPGQRTSEEKITKVEAELDAILERLNQARLEREEARKCLKLLYERDFELEPAARAILRKLGAHIEDPSEPNKEDGWITVTVGSQNYEGVLEIKSTRNDQFSESGRKQLLDWIDRGVTLRQKKCKGVFIGNSAVDKPLTQRPWAFSDSWAKAAELNEICAMKTEDLYVAYLLHAKGKLDSDQFWTDVFTTNGIFPTKKYLELLNPPDEES